MSMPERPRVAIYFRMFSPYILARIPHAARRMDVIGIEGSRRSTVYAWEPREADAGFERHTLFVDQTVEEQPSQRIAARLREVLDATQPDVVCVGGWSHTEALTMLEWACRNRRHAVLLSESSAHDAVRVGWRERLKRHIVGLCDAAMVGGAPQRAYAESLGMPDDRIFLGYDAVDNDYFAEGAAAARADQGARAAKGVPARYFMGSCRFIEKKNLVRLVDAFAAYRADAGADPWDLVLVGDGEMRPALEAQVAALGLSGAVHFTGFRQYDDLPAYYGLAGAFVHVSTVEQWGLVVNEAMAAGLPVLVSRTCGCATDLVEDGGNGFVVDPLDTTGITAALRRLAAPETDRAAMAERGRAIVADYGPDRFAQGLEAAVRLALAGAPRGGGVFSRLLLRRLAARNTRDGS